MVQMFVELKQQQFMINQLKNLLLIPQQKVLKNIGLEEQLVRKIFIFLIFFLNINQLKKIKI